MVSKCQIKKSYGPDMNLHRQTDEQNERRTDRVIPINLPELRSMGGGYLKASCNFILTEIGV